MISTIFGKQEVLISCPSLRSFNLHGYSLDFKGSGLEIDDHMFTQVVKTVRREIKKNAEKSAQMVYEKFSRGSKTDINKLIVEALLLRRYRGGRRELRSPQKLYEYVKKRTDFSKPIELTISLFPCKIPNPLKTAGALPDLADLASLARMIEISKAVQGLYEPGLIVIVLMDGYRFKDILDFPPEIISTYQQVLIKFLDILKGQRHVILEDYMDMINNKIPSDMHCKRKDLFKKFHSEYQELFGRQVKTNNFKSNLSNLVKSISDKNLAAKVIELYYSLIYSIYVKEIMKLPPLKRDKYALEVFKDPFNFHTGSRRINETRKNVVSAAWNYTISYVSEIASGRVLKPAEFAYPGSIRCDMHNIKGRLTLYAVNRSTKLTSFHGTGYVDKKGKISVALRAQLHNSNFLPIYGSILGKTYDYQPFCYVSQEFLNSFNKDLSSELISKLRLK